MPRRLFVLNSAWSEITSGFYFGNINGLKFDKMREDHRYSGKKAIISSLAHLLLEKEFINVSKVQPSASDTETETELNISDNLNACSDINQCISRTVTIKTATGFGSGFIISSSDIILTNQHVIEGEDAPLVVLSSGITVKAKILRIDQKRDVALIKIELEGLPVLTVTKIVDYSIGESVFAIGTPENIELGQTVSKGIISGIRSGESNMIQTDVR